MEYCNLYLTLPALDLFFESMLDSLSDFEADFESSEAGLVMRRQDGFQLAINFVLDEKELKEMFEGMYNFYAGLETKHKNIQETLLNQITMFNAAISVGANGDVEDEVAAALFSIAKIFGGLVFIPDGLYTGDGDLLLDFEGKSELETYSIKAHAALLDQHTINTESGEARKERSNKILQEYEIPICTFLPPIVGDENVKIRNKEEIARRMCGMLMLAIYGECLRDNDMDFVDARDFIQGIMERYGIRADFMTLDEEEFFLRDDIEEKATYKYVWRYECFQVGLWALGFVEKLDYPDRICDVSACASIFRQAGNFENFLQQAKLREPAEILDAADLILRMDWACVDARLKGLPTPGNLEAGVVLERHRMLNWLICYMEQDWDNVTTDT